MQTRAKRPVISHRERPEVTSLIGLSGIMRCPRVEVDCGGAASDEVSVRVRAEIHRVHARMRLAFHRSPASRSLGCDFRRGHALCAAPALSRRRACAWPGVSPDSFVEVTVAVAHTRRSVAGWSRVHADCEAAADPGLALAEAADLDVSLCAWDDAGRTVPGELRRFCIRRRAAPR
jgi:hypothetical protein